MLLDNVKEILEIHFPRSLQSFLHLYKYYLQANKEDGEQPMIADTLEAFDPASGASDVCVVGCGPAGLALAAELAGKGIHVALVGELSVPLS